MAQNIYDQGDFFDAYRGLRRSHEGLDGAAEWPLMRSMLPPLQGARIADLGCGFGWFCAWAADQGAEHILGLDLSERMLERARAQNARPAITYRRADLETLDLPPAAFDLVYSSLTFHYVEDLPRLLRQAHRALAPGGALVFSQEHPIYTAPIKPGWVDRDEGARAWALESYALEGPRRTDWLAKDVLKHHRTAPSVLNGLIGAGFAIARVEEFRPTAEDIAARPELADELSRPMFLMAAARKPPGG